MKMTIRNFMALSMLTLLLATCKKTQPTCNDGLKNGSETDVDCGGDCPINCDPAVAPGPCQGASNNVMIVNSTAFTLPYMQCTYSSPYYSMLRSSTSALTGSSYYVYIHFYGYPASVPKVYTATGSSNYPANNNEVRLRVKINGSWYYPSGSVSFDPTSGTYVCDFCDLYDNPYTVTSKITCN